MNNPAATFQHESDFIDILWRQDVDLGVERSIFDGCQRQKEMEIIRAKERERTRDEELEFFFRKLQKLDKETGEFLPSAPSAKSQAAPFSDSVSAALSQCSPVSQNPLLSALLLSHKSQKTTSEEQALSELLSLPDLQSYLDFLETESSSLAAEDVSKICSNSLSELRRDPSDGFCGFSELSQALSDTSQPSESADVLVSCMQTLSYSASPSTYCRAPENPTRSVEKCPPSSSSLEMSGFFPELTNPYSDNALIQPKQSDRSPQMFSHFSERCGLLGFDDSASVGSVDLETSLYDTLSSGQSDKEESDQSEFMPSSLDSEAFEATLFETFIYAQHKSEQHLQRESESNCLQAQSSFPTVAKSVGGRRTCRDEQRARGLGLPLSVQDIINLPVEAFNEAVSSSKLNHAQLTLIRDIRRRGKNKMAAQSCRKRKIDSLVDLEDEIEDLKREKEKMTEEKKMNTRGLHEMKEKMSDVCKMVFSQLKDEHGNSYNPEDFKLHHSTDGTVYLVQRRTDRTTSILIEDLLSV